CCRERRLELEPEARDQRYDHCDPEADRKCPGTDGKSRETERELSWRRDCRRRAPCGCSFRSCIGYCHVHFDFSVAQFAAPLQHRADKADRSAPNSAQGWSRNAARFSSPFGLARPATAAEATKL